MAADKEIMKAIERLRLDRPGRVIEGTLSLGVTVSPKLIEEALRELATTYREEAELWSRSGAKGWKSSEAEKYLVAQHIDDVAAQLDNAGGGAALSVSEPLPRQFADTTHERLDDFVNSAVAAGKGTLRDEASMRANPPLDLGTVDVTAYLKGEIDTLPGLAEALVPGSVSSPPEIGNPFEPVGEQGPELIDQETLAKLNTLHDVSIPTTALPTTWESDTLTADGFVKPGVAQTLAPTLGQPGDMGTGYSHTYIPAGGRAVTFAELLTPVPMASLPPHLSHSQTNTVGDCATKYRLQRVEGLPQIPQWANIGGTAFHAAVESWERMVAKHPGISLREEDCEATWKHHFEGQITAVAMTTPVPQSVWRAARKGAEGEQWWRVNGPLMLRRYLDARPDAVTAEFAIGTGASSAEPAIELDRTVDVPTPYGPVQFNAKIDRVTFDRETMTLTIRDYKTSYERPTDTTQLGDYAWVLTLAGHVSQQVKILGSYFDARRGEWTEPVDLLQAHPFEAFQYRVTTAHAQKRALTTGPTPARPSSYCGGCAVRYACPVMAAKS